MQRGREEVLCGARTKPGDRRVSCYFFFNLHKNVSLLTLFTALSAPGRVGSVVTDLGPLEHQVAHGWGDSHIFLSVRGRPSSPQQSGHSPYLNVDTSRHFQKVTFMKSQLWGNYSSYS